MAVLLGGKDVKADLRPVIDPLSQLDCFVLLVLGWQHAELSRGASLHREIAVYFEEQRLGSHRLRGIDLDFVVILRTRNGRAKQSEAQNKKEQDASARASSSAA